MAAEKLEKQAEEQESLLSFDPIVILMDVVKRWYLILLAAMVAAMGVYVHTVTSYVPQYTTNTTFVVSAQGSSATVYQNLSATTNLATVFSEVLNSSLLRKTVEEAMDGESFTGTIEASAIAETNLLTMRVTAENPRTAFLATKAVIEYHSVVSYQVMGDTVLEVLQQPRVPTQPSNPISAASQAKKGGLYAAVAMCALLAILSYLKDTVRSRKEASKKLYCRVLAEMKHEKKYKTLRAALKHKKTGILITRPTTSFAYTETVRTLRRKVEQHMPRDGKVILITSVLENEGKSTVAVNLALSFAQKQKKVLLLEGDLRKPACCKILEWSWRGNGIASVIRGEAKLESAALPYEEGKSLHVLLERSSLRNATELVTSPGMAELIRQVRQEYDYVILDTPPMSAGPDAECLLEFSDASILVVRQNQAPTKMINSALEVLRTSQTKLLGCVLNNCYSSLFSEESNYGYGYGYGYGAGKHGYGKYGYGQYGRYGAYGKYGAYATATEKREEEGQDRHE